MGCAVCGGESVDFLALGGSHGRWWVGYSAGETREASVSSEQQGLFHERIVALQEALVVQGRAVLAIAERGVEAVFEKDAEKAAAVAQEDDAIDRRDIAIEREAVALMEAAMTSCATQGRPTLTARDLRRILTIVKVNNEFERVGDLAVTVVTRMEPFLDTELNPPPRFRVMANSVLGMIDNTVRAFSTMDMDGAQMVLASDDATEAFRDAILRENEGELAAGRRTADYAFALNRVAAAMARMADHCTNVAEQIIYVATGNIVRHSGEKWTTPAPPPE